MKTRESPIAPIAVRAAAFEATLLEKGLLSKETVQGIHDLWDTWVPENGAKVVARAWTDPGYKKRLLDDAATACAELGFRGMESGRLVALENTPTLQHVIVCTLCSCTAWPVLGLPPDWYKSFEYRSRVVRESRQVLREMGLDLPPQVKIEVWDTTADTRYMVLPFRPEGTEGWSAEQLAAIVTKDCLIGVARPEARC
jgi:nitrile hydratase